MKRYFIILMAALIISACANDSESKSTKDTIEVKTDNTRVDDNQSGAGDTASYERMPQKTSDSASH